MKKMILSSIFAVAFIAIAGYGVNKSMNSYAGLNELALKNVIALANIEDPDTGEEGEGNLWSGYLNNILECTITETKHCDFEIWIIGYGYCHVGFDYNVKHAGTMNPCTYTGNPSNKCDYYRCTKS